MALDHIMTVNAQRAPSEPYEAPEAATSPLSLSVCLDRKLEELRNKRCEPLWIEASAADLTALVTEGAEDAVALHPNPAVDLAWYAGVEIRCGTRDLTWVYLKGEIEGDAEEVSVHIVSQPDVREAAGSDPNDTTTGP